jgi:AbrB family looped-hinge helix DNA binding protein
MQTFTAQLEKSGRILIPAPVRRKLALREGSRIVVKVNEKGGLDVESRSQALARVQSKLRKYIPEGTLVSDELIADRRAETARENRKLVKSAKK